MIRRMKSHIRVIKSTLMNQFDLYTMFGSLEREESKGKGEEEEWYPFTLFGCFKSLPFM